MKSAFLLLDIFLLLLQFCFLIDRKQFSLKTIGSALLPSLVVTVIFSEVAIFFVMHDVWNFNTGYLIGTFYRNLPLEFYLFVFAFSFAGLGIYNFLNVKFPKNDLQKFSLLLSNLLIGIFIALLFFARQQWFPAVTVTIATLLLLGIEYLNRLRFMYRFYRAFAACLILYFVSFALICNLPVITYNEKEATGLSLANIPFENHLYTFGMLLLGVYVSEYIKSRKVG